MANIKKFGGKAAKKEKSLPASMSEEAKAKFEELKAELTETGIDTVRYHRALVMMAKDLALEEMCEMTSTSRGACATNLRAELPNCSKNILRQRTFTRYETASTCI